MALRGEWRKEERLGRRWVGGRLTSCTNGNGLEKRSKWSLDMSKICFGPPDGARAGVCRKAFVTDFLQNLGETLARHKRDPSE